MIEFSGRGILLDIEGTTSSVSYVYDIMFPFARRELDTFLRDNWLTSELTEACDLIALDVGKESLSAWCGDRIDLEQGFCLVRDEVVRLMDSDVKATGLKRLQGMIWKAGFETGSLRAHVYDDVPPALQAWSEAQLDVRIYSSGSVQAQKLFFGYSRHGNLLHHFHGHYDTTTGPKREAASYASIAGEFGLTSNEILFLSDIPDELSAAQAAGMQTGLCVRPGNAEVLPDHGFAEITSFHEINLVEQKTSSSKP